MKYFLSIIIILSNNLFAQTDSTTNKSRVDSIVRTLSLRTEFNPDELAYALAEPFTSDSEKVRAIYYWMTQNISYDYQKYLKIYNNSLIILDDDDDIDNYYYKSICHTIITKKGVCEDYARLFQYLCKSNKIPCELIKGWGLVTKPTTFLNKFLSEDYSNHAWNAVMINKKWYLIDVTFASGYIDTNKKRFFRKLNDFYYLTPPKYFVLDHHPVQSQWQLLDKPLDIKTFVENAKYNREKKLNNDDSLKIINQTDTTKINNNLIKTK